MLPFTGTINPKNDHILYLSYDHSYDRQDFSISIFVKVFDYVLTEMLKMLHS
jgi:hypothetical protein